MNIEPTRGREPGHSVEDDLGRLGRELPEHDAVSDRLADVALRSGAARRRGRQLGLLAAGATTVAVATVVATAVQAHRSRVEGDVAATPARSSSATGTASPAHSIASEADFRAVVQQLVPMADNHRYDLYSGGLSFAELFPWSSDATLSLVVAPSTAGMVINDCSTPSTQKSYVCQNRKVAGGRLYVESMGAPDAAVPWQVTRLVRTDGTVVMLVMNTAARVSSQRAEQIVTSPLWAVDKAWLVRAVARQPAGGGQPSIDGSASGAPASWGSTGASSWPTYSASGR